MPTPAQVISYYSPISATDEIIITTFNDEPSSLAWLIPKHNELIIGGGMKAQTGKK